MAVKFSPDEKRLEEVDYLVNTYHVDDEYGSLYHVIREVDMNEVIVAYRSLVTAGKMGVEHKTPTHKSRVKCMTKGVDRGDQSKSGDVHDGSSPESLEPNSQSLGPAGDAGISVGSACGTAAAIDRKKTDNLSSLIDRCVFRQWSQD